MLAVSACASQYVHKHMQMKFLLLHTYTGCNEGVASEKMLLRMLAAQMSNTRGKTHRFARIAMLRGGRSV